MKNNKGFTLIELIMVTIILGILAAVAVPRYMGAVSNAEAAAIDADLVTTDTWVSMGDEDAAQRLKDFADLQVTEAVMAKAKPDALFMHCLPAHRGEEVEASVIDGAQSVIFDEAENRLHIQKAIMVFLLANN